ncbi:sugar transferase [Bacillus safensis]|uniref:sugar transferase n=1 Tax=Bacillus safensis TaxID=561879 RepID=UPI000B44E7E3|nr:sugar transferase [Bacillus safensis]PAK35539.1 sugar transferase [Bacillus safensis]
MKRMIDVTVALTLLITGSLLFLLIYGLIRWKLGTPVVFRQKRPGLYGRPFMLYKFRTMTDERDEHGVLLPDHLRLTKIGALIRKLSLDELPQLVNVLKGELSLVGPRPLLMEYLPMYTEEQARRHLVKPGITGWAQVNGRNMLSWEEKFTYDLWYVEHQSFWLDMKILWMTLLKVMKTEGVQQPDHATAEKFKGTDM